jgi:hypothetical protein
MKLSDFTLLSDHEKKGTLLHQGVLLAKREAVGCKVFLFGMNDYYVEMFCDMQNKAVQEYRISHNTKLLTPYLQAISLDDLLKN